MSQCIFCRIIARELPGQIVFEDDKVVAFKDINPMAPVHVLVVPRKHIASLREAEVSDGALLGHMQLVAARLAEELGIAEKGFRLVLNCGEEGGQMVWHLHLHLLGGRAMQWPPG